MSNYTQPIAVNGQPFVPGAVYEMQTSIQPQSIEKASNSQDEFFFDSLLRVAGCFGNSVDLSIYAYIQNQMVTNNQSHITLTKRIKNDIASLLRQNAIIPKNQNVLATINHSIKRMYHNDIIRYLGDGEFVLSPKFFISNNPSAVQKVIDLWQKTPIYVKGPSKKGGTGRPRKSND